MTSNLHSVRPALCRSKGDRNGLGMGQKRKVKCVVMCSEVIP